MTSPNLAVNPLTSEVHILGEISHYTKTLMNAVALFGPGSDEAIAVKQKLSAAQDRLIRESARP